LRHIELNSEMMLRGPDGFFRLERDREALEEFLAEVRSESVRFPNLRTKLAFLIENGYYENFFERYPEADVLDVFAWTRAFPFEFPSYMSAFKFYTDYALRTNDRKRILEHYPDRVAAVALHLAQGDGSLAKRLAASMMERRVQPATPTFLNAGRRRRGELVSCFLLQMDDTLNSINYVLGTCMQLSKIGGGVAVNVSRLRGRGEPIRGVEGAAKGVVPVLKLLEDAFSYADQMGQRKGAGAAYYHIFGWDVVEFLDTKKINADEKSRLKTLAIGLIVPDKFYRLARDNQPLYVFAPYSVYQAYGVHLDDMDMDVMYERLLADDRVKKKAGMGARDMLVKIATIQLESGYPYIVNITNANRAHALKDIGIIKMSNLCTEIFQLQEVSEIADYGEPDVIRRDICCNLASLNIANVLETGKLRESVHEGMLALTAVSDMSRIRNAPGVAKANAELHAVGLGAMNLHGFLAKNRIAYESGEALEFARAFFMAVNYHSLEKSMEIARERGVVFRDFERSEYAKGTYFDRYLETDFRPVSEKVRRLFAGVSLPGPEDWRRLKENVMRHGLYHAYRLAIAPTQSISYVQNATSGVMPAVAPVETRTYANMTTYCPMPYLSKDNLFFYKSAYHMDQFKVLDLIAEIAAHVDQGVSTVLHVSSDVSTRQLARYYLYAAHIGLKSLYYTRTNRLSVEECVSCAV